MTPAEIYELKADFIEFGNQAKLLAERLQPLMADISESDLNEMQCEALTAFLNRSASAAEQAAGLVSELAKLTDLCMERSAE